MTVISGIEVGFTVHKPNPIKEAIINNDPIDMTLHVICVINNPCLFARRYILMNEFLLRMKYEPNVTVYVVELCYENQNFVVTNEFNPRHMQLRTTDVLWHKENLINLGIKMLPKNYKAFAWIDADIEFDNADWAMDTLKILNGQCDIVQLFSHCVDMNKQEMPMNMFTSAGYQYCKYKKHFTEMKTYSHPGYAWAITRKAYEKMGGLYDKGILGSGDNIMAYCLFNHGLDAINEHSSKGYKESVLEFQEKVNRLRLGYVPGIIRHYYHGTKENRKYNERWKLLIEYNYSPEMVTGSILKFNNVPTEFKDKIKEYFLRRQEDS